MTAPNTPAPASAAGAPTTSEFKTNRSLGSVFRIAVVLGLLAVAFTTPGFISDPSILSLLTTVSFIGCVAVGMTLITLSGNIMSFSLGALVGATALIFVLCVNIGGVVFGLVAALAFGALVNGVQGFVIGWARANPIIVSIAAAALIVGTADAFAERGTLYANPGTSYGFLRGPVMGIPLEFLAFVAAAAVAQFLLASTHFGRNVYMLGSSYGAARNTGLRIWRTVTGTYALAGVFAALAGILLAVRYDSASMSYGVGYEYEAVAAVLVGGTAIKGGEGSVLRTFLGAMIIATIQVVLLLRGFRPEWQYLIAGVIVLAVVALQSRGSRE